MTRQGFSILVCSDPELIKDRVADLLHDSEFAARMFWGDEELSARYWQTLTVPSMMGPPNAVILRRAQDQPDEFWSRMEPLLAMARPSSSSANLVIGATGPKISSPKIRAVVGTSPSTVGV